MAKILVVDDTPVEQQIVIGLLTELTDLEIDCANHGKEALEMIAKDTPDIGLPTCRCPRWTGCNWSKRSWPTIHQFPSF